MPYYVKINPKVKERILPSHISGAKAADGNIILFQNDLMGVKGVTLSDRVAAVGGALLTNMEAKRELDGTVEHPAKCYDPEEKENEIPVNEEQANDDKEESEVNNG